MKTPTPKPPVLLWALLPATLLVIGVSTLGFKVVNTAEVELAVIRNDSDGGVEDPADSGAPEPTVEKAEQPENPHNSYEAVYVRGGEQTDCQKHCVAMRQKFVSESRYGCVCLDASGKPVSYSDGSPTR